MRAELDESGKRIHLYGWVGPTTPTLCKKIDGCRFSKHSGAHWSYPLATSTCKQMRMIFKDRLSLGPRLNAWAWQARRNEEQLTQLITGRDATLTHLQIRAPRIAEAMGSRTYQKVAAAFGARVGSFLLSDQPGVGKTIETLATIIEVSAGKPGLHLIFCPSIAINTVWFDEINQWLGGRAEAVPLTGQRPNREAGLEYALARAKTNARENRHTFVIANPHMAAIFPPKDGKPARASYPKFFGVQWDTCVADESQQQLIRTKHKNTQIRAGMVHIRAKQRIALSGTPMRGKPQLLWGTLNWLRPGIYTSYWRWVAKYWQLGSDGFSNYVIGDFLPGGEEALARDLASISLRRTKAEVMPELPAKLYGGTYLISGDTDSPHGVWLRFSSEQKRQYDSLISDGVVADNGRELIVNGTLPQDMRRKQICGAPGTIEDERFQPKIKAALSGEGNSAKFDWVVAKLVELGLTGSDEPVEDARIVIASQFTSLINEFASELVGLGIPVSVVTGKTPQKRRDVLVRDFQSAGPSARVFLINTRAAGVAITLDMADYLVLLDETWTPDDQEQVEDRIHRASRIHNVVIYYLRVLDSIEEEIAWITAAKENVQKYILDGSRGVEYARKLYKEKQAK